MKVFIFALFLSFICPVHAQMEPTNPETTSSEVTASKAQLQEEGKVDLEQNRFEPTAGSSELVLFVLFILLPIFYCLIRTNGKHA